MIAPLFSKLPVSRAADWGWKVTVCIAALCGNRKSIVQVSDHKVAFGQGFSADRMTVKDVPFYSDYTALVSGNDVEHAPPILERASEILLSEYQRSQSPSVVADAVDEAYGERLHKEIHRRVLRKRGFTVDSFRDHGKQKCTPSAYLNLCSRIDQVNLSLKFLVCGFDGDENPEGHIYCVDGTGAPKCYDEVGMWSIGTGARMALASLAFHVERTEVNVYRSEWETLYFCLAAKFMAEASGDVGESTFAIVRRAGDGKTSHCSSSRLDAVREMWESEGRPRRPSKLRERMDEIMQPDPPSLIPQSASETSESEP